jgi:hypothetical protein
MGSGTKKERRQESNEERQDGRTERDKYGNKEIRM